MPSTMDGTHTHSLADTQAQSNAHTQSGSRSRPLCPASLSFPLSFSVSLSLSERNKRKANEMRFIRGKTVRCIYTAHTNNYYYVATCDSTNSNDDFSKCSRVSPFDTFVSINFFQFVHQLQTKTTELLIFNFFAVQELVIALLFPKLKINISILGLHCLRMAPCKLHQKNLFLSNIG